MMPVVIDANLWLSAVIPLDYSPQALAHMQAWGQARARIVVPVLWHYEVISSLRKATALKVLSEAQALQACEALATMAFEHFPPSLELDRLALGWAGRLGQVVAYDAQYLALAEHLDGELWSADRRLVAAASSQGAAWVHWVGEDLL